MGRLFSAASLTVAALSLAPTVLSYTNYPAEFVEPDYVVQFQYPKSTVYAQQTIVQWANQLAKDGPWAVTGKKYLPPTGDDHDYLSWAPYYWPNCSNVANTTELTVDEMHKQCDYYNVDGKLNPEAREINNIGDFDDMANAVMYNALAWAITRSALYSHRCVEYIDSWFLNEATYMNPNLNYAQLRGGPTGQVGVHTGILDLKAMTKIASGVLILRDGNADGWNSTIDGRLQDWTAKYIEWITTNTVALQERASLNNHGTYYFAQLASLHVINNDKPNAASTAETYFTSLFQTQIAENGDQPLESVRTRPYHYLAYNLAGIMTVGRIGKYAGYDGYGTTSTAGGTIPKVAQFAMQYPVGSETADELYPPIEAVAVELGDSDNAYANWLNSASKGMYILDACYFWNQPLADVRESQPTPDYNVTFAELVSGATVTGTYTAGVQPSGGTNDDKSSSASSKSASMPAWAAVGAMGLVWSLYHMG